MQQLTEIALMKTARGIFTRAEIACWVGGSPQRQFSLVKRALASGEVLHLRRGLYALANQYQPQKLDPFVLAQRLYGPSYLSLETALSCHGWIPEAVYTVTSTSLDRSREFATPLGHFSFVRVPQKLFYLQVMRVEKPGGHSYFLASPFKALADYVYVHKQDWRSTHPLVESLRIDASTLHQADVAALDELLKNYPSLRVRRFLRGLRKELLR